MDSLICHCCGLLFTDLNSGTNRDGSKNANYCADCYSMGSFKHKDHTIIDMEKKLLHMARFNMGINLYEALQTISSLPDLKRWRKTHIL